MTASPIYARVVRIDHSQTIYVSGLYPADSRATAEEQIRSLFGELADLLDTPGGSDLKHLAKATYLSAASSSPVEPERRSNSSSNYRPACRRFASSCGQTRGVYFQDESRFGQQGTTTNVWALRSRPTASADGVQYLWVLGRCRRPGIGRLLSPQ